MHFFKNSSLKVHVIRLNYRRHDPFNLGLKHNGVIHCYGWFAEYKFFITLLVILRHRTELKHTITNINQHSVIDTSVTLSTHGITGAGAVVLKYYRAISLCMGVHLDSSTSLTPMTMAYQFHIILLHKRPRRRETFLNHNIG